MAVVVDALDHLVVNVHDVEVAAVWYQRVLGMTREDFDTPHGKVTAMRFGRQKINLRPITATKDATREATAEEKRRARGKEYDQNRGGEIRTRDFCLPKAAL